MRIDKIDMINKESASCHVTMTDYMLYTKEAHLCVDDDHVIIDVMVSDSSK